MREMQARRAEAIAKEESVANREQRGNREKRKPKKEKPKETPVSALGAQVNKPGGKGK